MERESQGGAAPGEGDALDFEVRSQALLDVVEQSVVLLQHLQLVAVGRHRDARRRRGGGLHQVSPLAIHDAEFVALLGHLLHDVRRREDGLEVLPRGLAREPVVQHVLQCVDASAPRDGVRLEVLHKRARTHALHFHDLIVEQSLHTSAPL